MSTSWDPDPDSPHITVVVKKTGRMVGLKAANAPSPHEYPFVQMIGVGTPIDTCQEIDIGDRLKSINGMFLKGKGRQDIHKLVREIEVGYDIVFQVIKSFKDKKFVQEMGSVGFRVASVRRQNPLLAMQLVDDDAEPEEIVEEESHAQGRKGRSISEADEVDVIMADGVGGENDESNEFGGFEEEENDDAYVGKLGRKMSTYGGFGDDDVKCGSKSNTLQNTIDIDGEDFGFGAMDNEDQWG